MFNQIKVIYLFLLSSLFLIWAPAIIASGRLNNARIVGKITDESNDSPLPYVQVFISNLNRGDVTNDHGHFRIPNLPAGQFGVTARLQGYKTFHFENIDLASNETFELNIALAPEIIEMSNVTITATRSEADPSQTLQQVSVVSAREIHRRNARQAPELLREETGILVQKTNQGGGSPVIRGLKANKLLLLVDGIRLNNATYRGGNTQYLNTVDAAILEKMEVVHGPVSVLYGSDALGGVINLITQSPFLTSNSNLQITGTATGTISTADFTKTTSAGIAVANNRFGLQVNGSLRSFGDIKRGESGGEKLMQRLQNDTRTKRTLNRKQSPNGYDAYDLSAKALVKISDLNQLAVVYQRNRQYGVPRYDVVEVMKDSIRLFDPQERDLGYIQFIHFSPHLLFDKLRVTLSIHRQFERRIRQKFGRSIETRDQFSTRTLGATVQFNKHLKNQNLVYGLEFYHDRVTSSSTKTNTLTRGISQSAPLFPNGSTFFSLGIFVQDAFQVFDNLRLTTGLRFSKSQLKAPFISDPASADIFGNIKQNSSALTASLGAQYFLTDDLSLVTNLAQGFRTPNLDDVSKLGPGKGASFYDVPNPNAKPEKSISFDGGLKLNSDGIRANFSGFYSRLTDLLVRRPTLFNGSQTIVDEGDTLVVFFKENAGRAFIAGFNIEVEIELFRTVSAFGNLSFTHGQNISNDEPLAGIPPLSGLTGLRWQSSSFWAELNSRFAREQSRLSSNDQQDLRIPEGGTPGWFTLNIRVGGIISKNLSLNLSVSNIFDRNYREHLSGFNAPGRNFAISARVTY